jgi:hypothetical protein
MSGACSTYGILKSVYKITVGKSEEKKLTGRYSHRIILNVPKK